MSRKLPWSLLGIAATQDTSAIRKAYAARIKAMDLDSDVEGYAALRHARDTALRLAKTMTSPAAEPDEADQPAPPLAADPPTPARWLHAAPELAGDWEAPPALSTSLDPAPEPFTARISPDFTATGADGENIAPQHADPFAPPLVPHASYDGTLDALKPGQSAFQRLGALIDADTVDANAPLSDAEAAESLRWLQAVLTEARHSDITRQAQIEDWLATLLAEAWPRCAPLLEAATAEFGWEREWGTIAARPAVNYLGQRLRGYRFQQKVLQPDHRYHKAWIELCRPGPAGLFRFLRSSSSDVLGLLGGIRKHFPELESHFDDRRVYSWENPTGWSTGTIVVVGLVILAFLISLGDTKPGKLDAAPPSSPSFSLEDDLKTNAATAAAIAEAFGKDRDRDWLQANQPELAQTIASNARYALHRNEGPDSAVRKTVEIVRERMYRDGRMLSGEDFETTMRIRLAQLRAARASSVATCGLLIKSGFLSADVPMTESLRERERRFASALVNQGALTVPASIPPRSASVPGVLVGKVIDATRLSEARVAQAMQGKGTDADRCAVAIALLDATLDWKGEGRKAILMTL